MINVSLQPGNVNAWTSTVSNIEKAFKEIYPDEDFDYSFLDESIGKYYAEEQNISQLLFWATGLSIFISSLGLLGLVSLAAGLYIRK